MRLPFRTIAFSSALCLGLASGSALFAQNDTMTTPQQQGGQSMEHGGMHRGPMSPDQELSHLTKKLNLTSDQQTKIKPILQERHDQLMQTHQDASMSRQDRMAKMKNADENANSKLGAVLNDQQKPEYEKMIADRKQHMQEMRAMRHNGDGQTSPSNGGAQPQ
jgi:protein CpxP